MAKWTVTIVGQCEPGVVSSELDRLARQFAADLTAAGFRVSDVSGFARDETDQVTSGSPNSDLPLSDGPQLE